MVKVIETNLILDYENNNIRDHQSRVIEVESWESYIKEIEEGKSVNRKSYIGIMHGVSVPKNVKIEDLVYNDFHLSYDVIGDFIGYEKKLAYLVK